MRAILIALIVGLSSSVCAADVQPFVLTCSKQVLSGGETVKSATRFDWDGEVLTSTLQNAEDKLDRFSEKVLAHRLLQPDSTDDVRFSFLTGAHAAKSYRYYTSFHFFASSAGGTLVHMTSTVDKDGFLIEAGSIQFEDCDLKFMKHETR